MMRIIFLRKRVVKYIRPKVPFNFDGTVFVPSHFPTPDFEWKHNEYWQTMNFASKLLGIRMTNKGTAHKPLIRLTIYSNRKLDSKNIENVLSELNWRYGFNEDISTFIKEFKSDKFLKPILKRREGVRINCANSLYELIIIGIVLQNTTVRRTVQMMNNLFNAYGTKLKFNNKELFAFWTPKDLENVTETELRALKVGYRAKMIKGISDSFVRGEVDEIKLRGSTKENAKEKIMKLYGIGPATAQIILGEYLRRHDVFDLRGRIWEQKILSRILFGKNLVPVDKIIKELSTRYGEWLGLAVHYLFQDLFWEHRENKIEWLEKEIRL